MNTTIAMSFSPLTCVDDFRALLHQLPGPDETARTQAILREPSLIKPRGSLGRLEADVAHLAAWQGRHPPTINAPKLEVFVGNHGVALERVSAYPQEVTEQLVASYKINGAAVNRICEALGINLGVTTLELDRPTRPFHLDAAMGEDDLLLALNTGLAVDLDGVDVLCVGETGIGNTTCAAAMAQALFGGTAEDWTGPGSGVAGDALTNKIRIVAQGVALHGPAATDPLDVLRRLGGRELAAIVGAIVAARLRRVPVILDGFTTCSAAACLQAQQADALDHCLLGHQSREPGHAALARRMGFVPIVQLGMALGEGTGAAMAVPLLQAALWCHTHMATFAEAGVTDRED